MLLYLWDEYIFVLFVCLFSPYPMIQSSTVKCPRVVCTNSQALRWSPLTVRSLLPIAPQIRCNKNVQLRVNPGHWFTKKVKTNLKFDVYRILPFKLIMRSILVFVKWSPGTPFMRVKDLNHYAMLFLFINIFLAIKSWQEVVAMFVLLLRYESSIKT